MELVEELKKYLMIGVVLGVISLLLGIVFSKFAKLDIIIGWTTLPALLSQPWQTIIIFIGLLIVATLLMGIIAKHVVRWLNHE